jgi:nucleoside-diphosphate-sugar epimerase
LSQTRSLSSVFLLRTRREREEAVRYFLTGATSFIGHVLSRQLVEAGHEVVTVSRKPNKTQMMVEVGVDVRPGDITDRTSLRDAMKDADGVFHDGGLYKIGAKAADRKELEKFNVEGTRTVLELMKELKIHKGVYTSNLAVYSDTHGRLIKETYKYKGPWLSEYERTKWKAHFEVALPMMEQRLPLVIVQPGLVYGPGDTSGLHTALNLYLRRKLLALPSKTAFCWSHVEDTARGHILAMDKGKAGETYIIGGPVHTVVDAFAVAEKVTGVPAPKGRVGPGLLKFLAAILFPIDYYGRLPEVYTYEGMRSIAGVTYTANDEKARTELGFDPRGLEAGLRDTLEHEKIMLARD